MHVRATTHNELAPAGYLVPRPQELEPWRRLLLVCRDGDSQRRCHVLVDVTCRHDIDVAGPRTLLSGRLVRATSLVTAQLSEVQRTPCTTVR